MFYYSIRQFNMFFFNDTATTEIYTLSLHDALPIWLTKSRTADSWGAPWERARVCGCSDRKSTRLNSSHGYISYAVFCLKKQNKAKEQTGPEGAAEGGHGSLLDLLAR